MKVVIFDWGGVIAHKDPVPNNDKEAIIRTIRSFNTSLSNDEAWDIYMKTLTDENGTYISEQNDFQSIIKWINRLKAYGFFDTTLKEFERRFIEEHLRVDYYKDLVDYIHSLKDRCKIGIFSDLIYCCYPALDKQVDLSQFDYVWLSYLIHCRKTSQEAFLVVENELQVSPSDIMFIDDTEINISNAKERGWNTCKAYGYELDKIKASIEKFLNDEYNKGVIVKK